MAQDSVCESESKFSSAVPIDFLPSPFFALERVLRDYITAARETPSWDQEKLYHVGRLHYGKEGCETIMAAYYTAAGM